MLLSDWKTRVLIRCASKTLASEATLLCGSYQGSFRGVCMYVHLDVSSMRGASDRVDFLFNDAL
jgi:hypothetical protein